MSLFKSILLLSIIIGSVDEINSIVIVQHLEDWACFQNCSHFQHRWPCCIIFWPLFMITFSTPNLPSFRHGVLLLSTWLPGLESPQALHRIKSIAVLSLFCLELKWFHCMLAPATPMILDYASREITQLPPRLHGRGHWNPKLRGWWGRCGPFQHPLTGGHPL